MKLFQINDTEWWAGNSIAEVRALYLASNEAWPAEHWTIRELSDEELDRKLPAFDEDERPIPDTYTSGREMLAEMIEAGFVASSEW